jgi:hypothetical protein
MTNLNIFDAYAHIRDLSSDDDVAAVESLDEATRQKLFDVISACKAHDAGAERKNAAVKSIRELEHVYNNSVAAYEMANPVRTTQADNMRAVSAAQLPGYKPKDDAAQVKALANTVAKLEAAHAKLANEEKPNAIALGKAEADLARARNALEVAQLPVKTKAAMDAANVALTDVRAELLHATAELRTLERKAGLAIDAWRLCQTTPTAEQVQRQYMARSLEERARRVAAGLSAEPVRVVSNVSELDRVLGARGKVATNKTQRYLGKR